MSRPRFPQGCVMNAAMRRLREREEERLLDTMREKAERIRELQEEAIRAQQAEIEEIVPFGPLEECAPRLQERWLTLEEGAFFEDEEPEG